MPGDDVRVSRRRFLTGIGLLVPMASVLACRPTAGRAPSPAPEGSAGPRRAAHTEWAEVGGRVTVYAAVAGEPRVALCYFNDEGGVIWKGLDGHRGPEELAAAAGRELGLPVDAAAVEDATLFVVELAKLGLVDGTTHFTLSRCEVGRAV
jgi:hypothetical protein